jgi:threonyl-tRNA synthetase
LLVVGDREIAANAVAVRTRSGEDLGSMPLEQLAKGLQTELSILGRTIMEG